MKKFISEKALPLAVIAFCFSSFGCQTPQSETSSSVNINANGTSVSLANGNLSINGSSVNMTANNAESVIETKEPEQYQANVSMRVETGGQQTMKLPKLAASVAKMGANRRTELTLPNNEKIIYLEKDGKNYIISPNRKQIGELTKESVGFNVHNLMMPEQVVARVKNLRGVERVGEEKLNGRDVIKYQYASVTDTKTQAGNVAANAYVLVDKETGLPLMSEINTAAQNSSVQGINALKIITEMNDVKTTADAALFEIPADYATVAPEQIRQQVNTAFALATTLLSQILKTNAPNGNSMPNTTNANSNSSANANSNGGANAN